MPLVASAHTRVTLDVAQTISAGSIRVQAIVVSNATVTPAEVVFTDADGTNILNITVPAQNTIPFEMSWMADNGLLIDSIGDANVVVTVFHGAIGA